MDIRGTRAPPPPRSSSHQLVARITASPRCWGARGAEGCRGSMTRRARGDDEIVLAHLQRLAPQHARRPFHAVSPKTRKIVVRVVRSTAAPTPSRARGRGNARGTFHRAHRRLVDIHADRAPFVRRVRRARDGARRAARRTRARGRREGDPSASCSRTNGATKDRGGDDHDYGRSRFRPTRLRCLIPRVPPCLPWFSFRDISVVVRARARALSSASPH